MLVLQFGMRCGKVLTYHAFYELKTTITSWSIDIHKSSPWWKLSQKSKKYKWRQKTLYINEEKLLFFFSDNINYNLNWDPVLKPEQMTL